MSVAVEEVATWNITPTQDNILTIDKIIAHDEINIILLTVSLGSSVFIMACGHSHADFTWQVKHPAGLWIGVAIVDFLMPITGMFVSQFLGLKPSDAMALAVLASCPTDGLSAVFSYWTNSEVCISIGITILSIALTVGSLPLGIVINSGGDNTQLTLAIIPQMIILYIIVLVLITLGLGLAVHEISEKWSIKFAKIASPIPLLAILCSIASTIIHTPQGFLATSDQWYAATLVPLFGLIYGYLLGLLGNQPPMNCRAIAFSSANKSILLAAEVIYPSFYPAQVVSTYPMLVISQLMFIIEGMFLVLLYQLAMFCWYWEP